MTSRHDAPLRVLMTADTVGGVWTYTLDLAAALKPQGVQTTLAVFGPRRDAGQIASAHQAGVEIVHLDEALDWTAQTPEQVGAASSRLAALAETLKPDLLQANSPALLAGVTLASPTLAVCHSDVKSWWAAVKPGLSLPSDLAWRAALMAQGYEAARSLVAPCRAFAEATRSAYGPSKPVQVVWNGRRTKALPSAAAVPEPFAFTAGRLWDEAKGIRLLDRAAMDSRVDVYAAGSLTGPNGAAINLQAVQPLGRLDETALNSWLCRRPIFVSPALYEPFGLAVLEAAQAGCPLVLSDIASFRELWEGAALFTPVDDAAALTLALRALAENVERRSVLGEAARKRASRYSLDRAAAGMLRIYRHLCGQCETAVA